MLIVGVILKTTLVDDLDARLEGRPAEPVNWTHLLANAYGVGSPACLLACFLMFPSCMQMGQPWTAANGLWPSEPECWQGLGTCVRSIV